MGQWTWMNGSSASQLPVYGTQGVYAPANTPRGMYEGCQWVDNNGNFWLFGGLDSTTSQQWDDLWEFNPTTNQWRWMKGTATPNAAPVYGTQGVSSPTNSPGGRAYGVSAWTDASNNLWLFGGWNNNLGGIYSDLWKYDIATNEWTWMKGANTLNAAGNYGIMGNFANGYHPGARCETTANWYDGANLWIFGGEDYTGGFSDMWKYNIGTNMWCWMKGPQGTGNPGFWGTKGTANINNIPSGRLVYAHWTDHLGNFWLFGGCDAQTVAGLYNDLWKYDPTTNLFTWMSGTSNLNDPGFCFGPCVSSIYNRPAGRFENRACTQRGCNKEHFEFFGGTADMNGTTIFNDLWDYNVHTNEWTLMSGSTTPNQPSNFGVKTVSSATNIPGSRMGALAWTDPITEDFWLYGGNMDWLVNHGNDVWRFVIDTTCPHIPSAPMAGFYITPDTGCAPLTVTFTDTTKFSSIFHWDFGDGSTDTVYSPLPHLYSTPGTYTVRLISDGTGECVDPDTMILTLTVLPVPIVDVGNDSTLCQGDSVVLHAGNPGFAYTWSTGATTESITVKTTGTYWIIVNGGACSDTDTVAIAFIPGPTVTLGNDTVLCAGQPITINAGNPGDTYSWSNGATTQTLSPTATGTYSVTVTNGTNCTGVDTIHITFTPIPVVNLGHDQSLCNNATINLNAYNANCNYLWSDGSTNSTLGVSTAGTYWVKVSNGNCIAYDTITFTVNVAPTVNIGPDIRLCYGQDTVLNAGNPGKSFIWSTGDTTQQITVTSSGWYWVNVYQNGCFGYDSVNVNISKKVEAFIGVDTFICPGDKMILDVGTGYKYYHWMPEGQSSHYINIDQPGTFQVDVRDSNDCPGWATILVREFCPCDMYVPNAFTPNGNKTNNIFTPVCVCAVEYHLYIFDRWGELIYETQDLSKGWDGTYQGFECQEGTYVYRLEYKLYNYLELQKHTKFGMVNLIR